MPTTIGARELIVIAHPEAGLRARAKGVVSTTGVDVTGLSGILAAHGARMTPLFGEEDRVLIAAVSRPAVAGHFEHLYYHIDAPDDQLDKLAEELRENGVVEAAYIKPAGELPSVVLEANCDMEVINAMLPSQEDAPPVTADFSTRQVYLEAAPEGIDARFAWTQTGGGGGGGGAGVRVIDCEWGWRFTHEDLVQNQGGVVAGTADTGANAVNHGTAVLGLISGDQK